MFGKHNTYRAFSSLLLPLLLSCGGTGGQEPSQGDLKVFHGKADSDKRYTSLVKIVTTLGGGKTMACSGIAVQADIIVTAAHCFESGGTPLRKDIVLSQYAIETHDNRSFPIVAYEASPFRLTVMDGHKQTVQGLDFAVVRTKTALGVPVANLPFDLSTDERNAITAELSGPDAVVALAGYGMNNYSFENPNTGTLRFDLLRFRKFTSDFKDFHYGDTEHFACAGDSGGGVFFFHQGKRYLLGVHSRQYTPDTGESCGFTDGSIAGNLLNQGHKTFYLEALTKLEQPPVQPNPEEFGIFPVPGRIEAEDFRVATDTTPENKGDVEYKPPFREFNYGVDILKSDQRVVVGYTQKNEVLRYRFRVTEAGRYELKVTASRDAWFAWETGSIKATITKDDVNVKQLSNSSITVNGWDSYGSFPLGSTELASGDYELVVRIEEPANLDFFTFSQI